MEVEVFGAVAPLLRHYDVYPVICDDAVFGIALMRYLKASSLSWSFTRSKRHGAQVALRFTTAQHLQEAQEFVRAADSLIRKQEEFPALFKEASARHQGDTKECSMQDRLHLAGDEHIRSLLEEGLVVLLLRF